MLVKIVCRAPGIFGARLTGGGFGEASWDWQRSVTLRMPDRVALATFGNTTDAGSWIIREAERASLRPSLLLPPLRT